MDFATSATSDSAEHGFGSRRRFLKQLGAAGIATVVGTGLVPLSRPIQAWGDTGAEQNTVLVTIFLRGGADGLHIVNPHGDDDYYRQRGDYGLSDSEFTDLDGFFGLNNSFADLLPLWNSGQMSVVHAVGSHDDARSHFLAQPNMDTAFGDGGWLQRMIAASHFASGYAGISVGDRISPPLIGPFGGATVNTIQGTAETGVSLSAVRPALEALYGATAPALERGAVIGGLAAVDQLLGFDPMPGEFPNTDLGRDLREAASLIRADIGIRAVALDYGGWDHHRDGRQSMEIPGAGLSAGIAAFMADLGAAADRVIVCVNTEFGRSARPNGNAGTGHGHGTAFMLFGKPLVDQGGGKVLTPGGWPGLGDDDLYEGNALAVTTDFRSVFSELGVRHLGLANLSSVFPGFTPEPIGLLHRRGDVDGSGSVEMHDAQDVLDGSIRSGRTPVGDLDRDGDNDLLDALLATQEAVGQ